MTLSRPLAAIALAASLAAQSVVYAAPAPSPTPDWQADYARAVRLAERQKKMLLLCFCDPADNLSRRFEAETLGDAAIARRLARGFVCVRLALDARVETEHGTVELLKHAAFAEMLGRPGIAAIDFCHDEPAFAGCVVSVFPLTPTLWYGPKEMAAILDLPPGTLTQRTLIYAVRTHPEQPGSASGQLDPRLAHQAESHAENQAQLQLQGHHSWETRFHRINAILPSGLTAKEVCAESWPGQGLVESAVECVRCWRCSQGHWIAVCGCHPVFGYDMKRGANGVWYATGIFGCRCGGCD